MEINGKSKRTMWDGSVPNPSKQIWPRNCAVCGLFLASELMWQLHSCNQKAEDDGVNYDADVLEEEVQGLSEANRAFSMATEEEEFLESLDESLELPNEKIVEIQKRFGPSISPHRPTSMEINGMELSKQPPGGWVGSPEKVELLRKIGTAAARKFPDQAVKIEPRDNQTQDIYTLSVRPRNLQRVDSVEKLKANNWVGVSGGSLADLLEFCRR